MRQASNSIRSSRIRLWYCTRPPRTMITACQTTVLKSSKRIRTYWRWRIPRTCTSTQLHLPACLSRRRPAAPWPKVTKSVPTEKITSLRRRIYWILSTTALTIKTLARRQSKKSMRWRKTRAACTRGILKWAAGRARCWSWSIWDRSRIIFRLALLWTALSLKNRKVCAT